MEGTETIERTNRMTRRERTVAQGSGLGAGGCEPTVQTVTMMSTVVGLRMRRGGGELSRPGQVKMMMMIRVCVVCLLLRLSWLR